MLLISLVVRERRNAVGWKDNAIFALRRLQLLFDLATAVLFLYEELAV